MKKSTRGQSARTGFVMRRAYKHVRPDPETGIIQGFLLGMVLLAAVMIYTTAATTNEEHFSQILLNDRLHTPQAVEGLPYTFAFTIENHEGRDAVYQYTVSVGGTPLSNRKIIVESSGAYLVTEKIPPLSYQEVRVDVQVRKDNAEKPLTLFFPLKPV